MYHTILTILQYDTIHTIHTLYRTIHEYLRYADIIRNFLHTIRIAYRTILTTMTTPQIQTSHLHPHVKNPYPTPTSQI